MTTGTHQGDGVATGSKSTAVTPLLATGQLPADRQPSVTVRPLLGAIVAGSPVSVEVVADEGEHWFRDPNGDPDSEPKVGYTGTTLTLEDGTVVGSADVGGGDVTVTFPRPGRHRLRASCTTDSGGEIESPAVAVRVLAAGPPVFTVASPADGTVVNLNEGGAAVDVRLAIPAGQYFPLTVEVIRDGVTSTGVAAGPDFATTVPLAPMPLGPRPLTVRVSDQDGQTSTQTRTLSGRDVAVPHLVVEFPTPSANVIADATGRATVAMHGTAPDSQSGMVGGHAGVAWALSPSGPRTPAQAATGNDFGTWRADVPLTGFGAHTIHVWRPTPRATPCRRRPPSRWS
jgi:hypothetical protein